MRVTFHISEDASRNNINIRKRQKTIKITREIWSKPLWVKLCKFLQVLNRINIEPKHTRCASLDYHFSSTILYIGKFFMPLFHLVSFGARCSYVQWFPFFNRIIRAHNQDCPAITFWRDFFSYVFFYFSHLFSGWPTHISLQAIVCYFIRRIRKASAQ